MLEFNMSYSIDLIHVPIGYSDDVHEFCKPILEVALIKGESDITFDTEFFYELLERRNADNDQARIVYNAQQYLDQGIRPKYAAMYQDPFSDEFEQGCLYFIKDFLRMNLIHSTGMMKSNAWKIELQQVTKNAWKIIKTS